MAFVATLLVALALVFYGSGEVFKVAGRFFLFGAVA
jgi:hypothetical protein